MAQLQRHALQMNDPQKVSLINARIINDAYALHAHIYARLFGLFGWTSLVLSGASNLGCSIFL